MSENIDELRNMLITFRVSELQMLLGFAGRNKTGRKTELQQRALELLNSQSQPIYLKIRDLYKTIQLSGILNNNSGTPQQPTVNNFVGPDHLTPIMPQQQGNMPRNTATIHPYSVNMDNRPMSTRQTASMYNQNLYQSYQQYPPQNRNVLATTYPVLPDVKFKRLPFFDVIGDLLKPSSLIPQNNQRHQEGTFHFHLTPQQATDVASSRDIRPGSKCEYIKQVQLRFCLLETTCEQEDCFPPGVIVKVNNKLCPLPNPIPTNKPGVEPKRPPRPVNVTQMVKLSPTVANTIHVAWAADYTRGYAVTVALVHKRTSSDLLQRMKSRGAKHADHTRGLIKEKLNEDADSEIATTCLRVSLMCPLGKMRMTIPCRPITCQHLQCFDASLFLQMNERKPTWNCPVCDKPATYENLVIDGYFQEVLGESSSDVGEIQLHNDGSWSVQTAEKKPVAKVVSKPDESIEIIADDSAEVASSQANAAETPDSAENGTATNSENTAGAKKKEFVDLTASDSDDEPLAKRRAENPKPDSTNKFSEVSDVSSTTNYPLSAVDSGYPASVNPSPPCITPKITAVSGAVPASATGLFYSNTSMPSLDIERDYNGPNYAF